jgi:hypothetical protein
MAVFMPSACISADPPSQRCHDRTAKRLPICAASIADKAVSRHHPRRMTPATPLLSVTALEQIFGACLKALRAQQFEAEGVGEPVGRVERGADR